ncbi:hypothetical protein BGX23_010480 [Mortierella sp. AD031]|nr:hypothetical protein BGX23_010480 [Mortierella sp. AD031]
MMTAPKRPLPPQHPLPTHQETLQFRILHHTDTGTINSRQKTSVNLGVGFDQDTGEIYEKKGKLDKGERYAIKTYWSKEVTENGIDNEIKVFEDAGRRDNLVKYVGVINNPARRCLKLEIYLDRTQDYLLKRRGSLTKEEVRFIGGGIAAGLAYLEKEALVHCDLKPENIVFSPTMVVKIEDLGLAERLKSKRKNPWIGPVDTKGFVAPRSTKSGLGNARSRWRKPVCWTTPRIRSDQSTLELRRPGETLDQRYGRVRSFAQQDIRPPKLVESVFNQRPKLVTAGKRKALTESEEQAQQRVKYEYDDILVDSTTLIYSSDSDINSL